MITITFMGAVSIRAGGRVFKYGGSRIAGAGFVEHRF
jgi:hypothetical protein